MSVLFTPRKIGDSEFLSPYFNVGTAAWGGGDENRFRFLEVLLGAVKKVVSDGYPVLIKVNVLHSNF